MIEYEVVPARFEHAVDLANNMAEADRQELYAVGAHSPLQGILSSVAVSRDATSGLADGRVVCMFGIATATALSFVGVPWMLGAEELPQHARRFLRLNKAYMEAVKEEYSELANFVDARNKRSIRWLEWLGFDFDKAVDFGPYGLPFHRFHWEVGHV